MGLIAARKEIAIAATRSMEEAFKNILDEIIEHAIEGICFEAHRAVKLDYFSYKEYILKECKFEKLPEQNNEVIDIKKLPEQNDEVSGTEKTSDKKLPEQNNEVIGNKMLPEQNDEVSGNEKTSDKKLPKLKVDIFGNKVTPSSVLSCCLTCGHCMAASALGRHMKRCKSKQDNLDNSVKTENCENSVNEKRNNGPLNYDTMSKEQKEKFLLKHCGVVSKRTGKPCNNSLKCPTHSKEDRYRVRNSTFDPVADYLADGNIDIDTVD